MILMKNLYYLEELKMTSLLRDGDSERRNARRTLESTACGVWKNGEPLEQVSHPECGGKATIKMDIL